MSIIKQDHHHILKCIKSVKPGEKVTVTKFKKGKTYSVDLDFSLDISVEEQISQQMAAEEESKFYEQLNSIEEAELDGGSMNHKKKPDIVLN